MERRMKYFVFNKAADYLKGCMYNTEYKNEKLTLVQEGADSSVLPADQGLFISRVLDSKEQGTRWHRLVVTGKSPGEASLRFRFYVSELPTVRTEQREVEIGELIRDQGTELKEKLRWMAPYLVKTVFNPQDILLHEAKGRYLWFTVEMFGQEEAPELHHIKLYLEKENWMAYLPQVYQTGESTFLERYLFLFQSLHQDLEQSINHVAGYLDPDLTDGEFLRWLTQWISLDDEYIWNQEQLQYLVKNGINMYRKRGTKEAISQLVELYLGTKPYIVEHYQIEQGKHDIRTADLIETLYGDSPYQFTVVVNEDYVPNSGTFKTLLKIVDSAKPAHMEANVAVLKPYLFLNKYSYLGMNSTLGQYRPVSLDGFSALAFANITEDSQQRKDG